jgi:hypothetical protein
LRSLDIRFRHDNDEDSFVRSCHTQLMRNVLGAIVLVIGGTFFSAFPLYIRETSRIDEHRFAWNVRDARRE